MNSSDFTELLPFEARLLKNLQVMKATEDLCVAFSGGLDSKSLLHALVRLKSLKLIQNLQAIHVNHGLQKIADQWLIQCQLDCQDYQIPFISQKLSFDQKDALTNVEAFARDGRYKFFESVLLKDQPLVMAHHQDDQAETLLFRLLRGCGLDGAAGMPKSRQLGKGRLIRPLLNIPRSEIEDYAKANNLRWIEDPTNSSEIFSRNFLRHKILTKIKQKWPGYNKTLSRFTQIVSEQNGLLDEIAFEDFQLVQQNFNQLNINRLTSLSLSRQKNLLHYWGKKQGNLAPSFNEINQIISQLHAAKNTAINIRFSTGRVRSFNLCLVFSVIDEPLAISQPVIWNDINENVRLSNQVVISAKPTTNVGLRLPNKNEKIIIKAREGGEKCLPDYRERSTDLKKIYQELNVPPWQRTWLPVIYYDETIVAVPGVFVNKNYLTKKGEKALNLKLKIQN